MSTVNANAFAAISFFSYLPFYPNLSYNYRLKKNITEVCPYGKPDHFLAV